MPAGSRLFSTLAPSCEVASKPSVGRSACATLLTGRLQVGCVVTLAIAHNRFRRHPGFLKSLQQRVEFWAPNRLGEVAIHAGVDAALVVALHGVRGHSDDGLVPAGAALGLADRGGGFEAIHLWHLYIHQHQVERLLLRSE